MLSLVEKVEIAVRHIEAHYYLVKIRRRTFESLLNEFAGPQKEVRQEVGRSFGRRRKHHIPARKEQCIQLELPFKE